MRVWLLTLVFICGFSLQRTASAETVVMENADAQTVLASDSKYDGDPRVLAGVDFAANVAGNAYGFSSAEKRAIAEALKGVCGIESRCNPTFIHYTPGGSLSRYQGIGQLDWSETQRAHKRLIHIANALSSPILKEQLQKLNEQFVSIVDRSTAPAQFVGDPRFDPQYGPLLLMAIHAETSYGQNLLRAVLRTFPIQAQGEDARYSNTTEGIVPDRCGTITAVQVLIAVIQAGQLNPAGLISSSGEVAMQAPWSLTATETMANSQLLLTWIVKPNESTQWRDGVRMQNATAPKTKGEAIANIIRNSEAKYHADRATRDNNYWRAKMAHLMDVASEFISAGEALATRPQDADLEHRYLKKESVLAAIGWAVRTLFIDDGSTVNNASERGKNFREILAQFRVQHYESPPSGCNCPIALRYKEQVSRAKKMRDMGLEQLGFKDRP